MADTLTIVIIIIVVLIVIYFFFYPTIKETFGGSNDKVMDLENQIQLLKLQQQQLASSGSGQSFDPSQFLQMQAQMQQPPQPINVNVSTDDDPYADYIKKTDLYTMYDPLTYPQMRMDRHVLDLYKQYYEKNGTYPPFNLASRGYLFDNPILVGYLRRVGDGGQGGCGTGLCNFDGHRGRERGPNGPNDEGLVNLEAPYTMPIFMVKSAKNNNRYFYYTIDQKYYGNFQTKIPFENVILNGQHYRNAEEYGIPEIFNHDTLEINNIYPGVPYRATIYKQNHFP